MATNDTAYEQLVSSIKEAEKLSEISLSGLTAENGAVAEGVDICAVYSRVRPFLELILKFPFIPGFIKDGIRLLMTVLDSMCPQN